MADGKFGIRDESTGEWNGMVGTVQRKVCHAWRSFRDTYSKVVISSAGLPMWGAWCKTLVGGFSLGEWEPLCPRPTLPEAACNTAGGLGGAVSPPAGSGRERILAIMSIKFASNNVPGKISVQKNNPLWGTPNCGGPGAAAPFAPLLIRHW